MTLVGQIWRKFLLRTYSQQIDAAIYSEDNLVVRAIAEVVGRAELVDEGIQDHCGSFHALVPS